MCKGFDHWYKAFEPLTNCCLSVKWISIIIWLTCLSKSDSILYKSGSLTPSIFVSKYMCKGFEPGYKGWYLRT